MNQESSPSTTLRTSLRIAADLKQLAAIRRFVEEAAAAFKIDPDAILDVVQAVDESAANIIMHGYRGQPGSIEIAVRRDGNALVIQLRDQARPFDPTSVPPPDVTLPLERRPVGGLGIYLTRLLVDEMRHRATPQGGNELTLVKKIQPKVAT